MLQGASLFLRVGWHDGCVRLNACQFIWDPLCPPRIRIWHLCTIRNFLILQLNLQLMQLFKFKDILHAREHSLNTLKGRKTMEKAYSVSFKWIDLELRFLMLSCSKGASFYVPRNVEYLSNSIPGKVERFWDWLQYGTDDSNTTFQWQASCFNFK